MSKGFKIEIDDKELNKALAKIAKAMPEKAVEATRDIVLDLAGKSAALAPIETGDLRNNCVAKVYDNVIYENQAPAGSTPAPKGSKIEGSVGYGLPYALRQHEDLALDHSKTDGGPVKRRVRYKTQGGEATAYVSAGTTNAVAGGEAKFLEIPFTQSKPLYIKRYEEALQEALEEGA